MICVPSPAHPTHLQAARNRQGSACQAQRCGLDSVNPKWSCDRRRAAASPGNSRPGSWQASPADGPGSGPWRVLDRVERPVAVQPGADPRGRDDRQKMRASNHDRQEVVDRLSGALEDGRLEVDEFEDRVGLAYQAVTYGDLTPLDADLPAAGSGTGREAAPPALAPPACIRWQGVLADLPTTLKMLWTIWLTAVLINVVVWALVSGTSAHLVYPWRFGSPVRTGPRRRRGRGAAGRRQRGRAGRRHRGGRVQHARAGRIAGRKLPGRAGRPGLAGPGYAPPGRRPATRGRDVIRVLCRRSGTGAGRPARHPANRVRFRRRW